MIIKIHTIYIFFRKTGFQNKNQYYNNPYYGVLILMANPSLATIEFDIEDGKTIRIPYPLESALERYNSALKIHNILYGN